MWHDNETNVDYVNFRLVAKACAELIRETGDEPISIGVSGGWGTGKSSMVKMITSELPDQDSEVDGTVATNNYVVVTFNPWLYQGFEEARTALLQLIGDVLLAQAEQKNDLVDKAKSLFKSINLLRLAQLGAEATATICTGVPVGPIGSAIVAGINAWTNKSVEQGFEAARSASDASKGLSLELQPSSLPKEIQSFRNRLEELLQHLDITLVVFVDDLDRCLPQTAISTLESIRLLLFLRRSAFVIAADEVFIRGAVQAHFSGTGLDDNIAMNYFDKLIQVPLRVPRLGVNETKAFVALLFLDQAYRKKEILKQDYENAIDSVETRLQETWKGKDVDFAFLESLVPNNEPELLGLMGLAERLAPLLYRASAVQANPRLIKRFLNTVFLRKALAKPQNIEVDVNVLAKWHLLERCDEHLASTLAKEVRAETQGRILSLQKAEDSIETLAKTSNLTNEVLCRTNLPEPFVDDPFTREWLSLKPRLGDVDMRSILHLSRDTTVSDFGGDALSQAGKKLLDSLVEAKTSNKQLSQAIEAAGEHQAGLALAEAWEHCRTNRKWDRSQDVLMLVEVTRVYPTLGPRAASLLNEARVSSLAPGLILSLKGCEWATEILSKWSNAPQLSHEAKRCLEQLRSN